MKFRSTFRGHEIEDREINRRNSVCTTKFGPTIVDLSRIYKGCAPCAPPSSVGTGIMARNAAVT